MARTTAENSANTIKTKSQRNARKIVEKLFKAATNENAVAKGLWFTEKLFWVVVYLSGVTATILTSIDLYQNYQDHPYSVTSTPVQIEPSDLPNVTLCLPFFNVEKLIQFWIQHDYVSAINGSRPFWEALDNQDPQHITLNEKIGTIFTYMVRKYLIRAMQLLNL